MAPGQAATDGHAGRLRGRHGGPARRRAPGWGADPGDQAGVGSMIKGQRMTDQRTGGSVRLRTHGERDQIAELVLDRPEGVTAFVEKREPRWPRA